MSLHNLLPMLVLCTFKKPSLDYSGYEAVANVSKLSDQYHLGLAYEKENKILEYPQFSIPIVIN